MFTNGDKFHGKISYVVSTLSLSRYFDLVSSRAERSNEFNDDRQSARAEN